MTPAEKLKTALAAINWKQHVDEFVLGQADLELLGNSVRKISLWCSALSSVEATNPAISFLAEAQAACHYVAALIPLALYKPAAASMRTVFESILYYSYFRTHLTELGTLVSNTDYYIDKRDVLDFHKLHTSKFKSRQELWGLVSRINAWYSRISSIIHGQLPGTWVSHRDLAELKSVTATRIEALTEFGTAAELVGHFLLCSMDSERWSALTKDMKQEFLKSVPGAIRKELGLSII